MYHNFKQEPVFDLIKSMSKAEKRNFKLYATRLSGNQDAKFLILFDVFDSLDEYDEARILRKCPVTKAQLPNMKAHLYKQILISIRLLNVQHNPEMQMREQIDFARILCDKGHYKQSLKTLEKAKEIALANEHFTIALEITEFKKAIENLYITRSMVDNTEATTREADELCTKIARINELTNIAVMLYGLYLKLGYVRSEKDVRLVTQYFAPRLEKYRTGKSCFTERVYYFQSMALYKYIQHDFTGCYRYALGWTEVYDSTPHMKTVMYDNYLKGYSRMMEVLFFMNSYRRYAQAIEKLAAEKELMCSVCDNAEMLYYMAYYYGRMNQHFLEGTFAEGVLLVKEIEKFIKKYNSSFEIHQRMLFYYKIACLYFGNDDYRKCIEYLQKIISTRDPQIRRDLQCFARILNLIASYEAGIDYNIDYQIKAVYSFLVKMNDMHEVQREMIAFIKKLNSIYTSDFKQELKVLYERLEPFTRHPYERRAFFYLDIIAYLESKIKGISVAQVIRERYKKGMKPVLKK